MWPSARGPVMKGWLVSLSLLAAVCAAPGVALAWDNPCMGVVCEVPPECRLRLDCPIMEPEEVIRDLPGAIQRCLL